MKIKEADIPQTMMILALASLVIYFITTFGWLIWLATGLLVVSLKPNPIARTITRSWLILSEYIGTFMTSLILSIIFFVLLTPVAALYRLFNKDKTSYFFNRKTVSTYHDAVTQGPESFERPW